MTVRLVVVSEAHLHRAGLLPLLGGLGLRLGVVGVADRNRVVTLGGSELMIKTQKECREQKA